MLRFYFVIFMLIITACASNPTPGLSIQTNIITPQITTPTTTPADNSELGLNTQSKWYLLGVNYPWLNYGHDFGSTAWGHDGVSSDQSREQIDDDFAYLKRHGVQVVRWFLFGDGRAAPEFNNGKVIGFDEYFYLDLDTALNIAQKHDMYLVLVLFDFHLADKAKDVNGVQLGGHSQMIANPEKRQSFLDNGLKPLLEKYGESNNIIAWEVMNEPEGAMDIPAGRWVDEPVTVDTMQVFVSDVVKYIHTYSSQYATVGSASRGSLSYWTGSQLDFYQYHYYDHMEKEYPFDYPYAELSLDKPVILGEFPTNTSRLSLQEYLDITWHNGYAGALAWSYRAGDEVTDFRGQAGEFLEWSQSHQDFITIR